MRFRFFKNINFRSFSVIIRIFFFSLLFYQNSFARILNENGKVLKEVVEIFRHYKPLIEQYAEDIVQKKSLSKEEIDYILSSKTPISDISLTQLNDIAQVVFLRPSHTERKDIKPQNEKFLPYTNQAVLGLFHSIGDIGPVYPKKKSYRYILFNGSTVKNMRQRLKTLVELVKVGKLHFRKDTEIIFLTGERDLFPEENEAQLMDPEPLKQDPCWDKPSALPTTEDQAAEWIWNQTALSPLLRKAKITFVRAKKKTEFNPKTGETLVKRPTTFDTVQTWIQEKNPKPGRCLSISNQPFVYYQKETIQAVFKKAGLLKKGFSVEGAGFGSEDQSLDKVKENIAVILDNFARTIYTEIYS